MMFWREQEGGWQGPVPRDYLAAWCRQQGVSHPHQGLTHLQGGEGGGMSPGAMQQHDAGCPGGPLIG